jgi:hypothetical protein
MIANANFETLEDLFSFTFDEVGEVEELPTESEFLGGAVRFLKHPETCSVKVELPNGAIRLETPSWSRYVLYIISPVTVKAVYKITYTGEERFLWDQEATVPSYDRAIEEITLNTRG